MPDVSIHKARFCSQCGQAVVVADADFCKECGAPLAGTMWLSHQISWRPLVALTLSIVPGLGQLYKGRTVRAVIWFIAVVYMYTVALALGMFLHLICALNAALSGAIREEAIAKTSRVSRGRAATAATEPRP